ncbi:MAG: rhomboid family intramembrane serine protease [Verrucomicrobiales bacterium]|nr:rhomboid family intramembrane serine protease [Verrucomicrobiales bacterium]
MRLIGHLDSEGLALRLSGHLGAQGILHQVEEDESAYAVWVYSEEDLERARAAYMAFMSNPQDPRFRLVTPPPRLSQEAPGSAGAPPPPPKPAGRAPRANLDRAGGNGEGTIAVTVGILLVCLVLAWVTKLGGEHPIVRHLQISEVPFGLFGRFVRLELFLPEVLRGEVWRLFTPALLHFSVAHVLFNLWTFWDLGRLIEIRRGSSRLLALIIGIGVISNLGQYLVSGPRFGGMSGVIYGLLGYAWMMGKYRPSAGIALHPQVVVMMLVWFVICLSDALGVQVANTAHGVGLVAGIVWGRWAASRG